MGTVRRSPKMFIPSRSGFQPLKAASCRFYFREFIYRKSPYRLTGIVTARMAARFHPPTSGSQAKAFEDGQAVGCHESTDNIPGRDVIRGLPYGTHRQGHRYAST